MFVTPWFSIAVDDALRVRLRGPGGVHVGHHRGDPQGRVEKGEERKRGKVDLIGAEVEVRADLIKLGLEVPVGVDGTLGRPGAAGGEEDGRHVARPVLRPQRASTPGGAAA